ncbi:MAG TPA: GGDEF domain-containing protein, partial [Polyangiaceae bacterium]|nr:GGDEF domain-containing protein [Polyangiaceae bacterium]
RRLGTSESFDRLVDLLSQFVSQVTTYRWMAVFRHAPQRLGMHTNPQSRESALAEAAIALHCNAGLPTVTIEDEDAVADAEGPPPMVEKVHFGEETIATFALAPRAPSHPNDPVLVKTIASELGGALRMATLVEESRSMATTDTLTGLLNRRAFVDTATREVVRTSRYKDRFSIILMDVDHFKLINDRRGHAGGDAVLASVARLLATCVRSCDVVARWGGEEFVVALPSTGLEGAAEVAERLRSQLESREIIDTNGERVPVTASFGVAELSPGEKLDQLIDRSDRGMYAAKTAGRNRVFLARGTSLVPGPLLRSTEPKPESSAHGSTRPSQRAAS